MRFKPRAHDDAMSGRPRLARGGAYRLKDHFNDYAMSVACRLAVGRVFRIPIPCLSTRSCWATATCIACVEHGDAVADFGSMSRLFISNCITVAMLAGKTLMSVVDTDA